MRNRIRNLQSLVLPGLQEAIYAKHKHLTLAQQEARGHVAVHEAAHFVPAVLLGGTVWKACIKVPGRTPKNCPWHRGRSGFVDAHHSDALRDMIITAAGPIAEVNVNPNPSALASVAGDLGAIRAHVHKQSSTEADRDAYGLNIMDLALLCVVDYWPAIDGVAAGFLTYGDSAGVVSAGDCGLLAAWVRSYAWRTRVVSVHPD